MVVMGTSSLIVLLFFILLADVIQFVHPTSIEQQQDLLNDSKMLAPKRSTMLLNRLMHALNKAFHHENMSGQQMELQRRGEGKMYWKCYFNAVSCFRRK